MHFREEHNSPIWRPLLPILQARIFTQNFDEKVSLMLLLFLDVFTLFKEPHISQGMVHNVLGIFGLVVHILTFY